MNGIIIHNDTKKTIQIRISSSKVKAPVIHGFNNRDNKIEFYILHITHYPNDFYIMPASTIDNKMYHGKLSNHSISLPLPDANKNRLLKYLNNFNILLE